MAGLSIALEGLDGSGKSTQLARLQDWAAARQPGREILLVREPGATPLGERVRELLLRGPAMGALAETLLYMAARAELYERVVLPALERGALVLLDRSVYSTVAYQGGGLGLDGPAIQALGRWATRERLPDRVLILALAPARAAARSRAPRDRIESRDQGYFERVARSYADLARAEPERVRVVEGDAPPDDVFASLTAALRDLL